MAIGNKYVAAAVRVDSVCIQVIAEIENVGPLNVDGVAPLEMDRPERTVANRNVMDVHLRALIEKMKAL